MKSLVALLLFRLLVGCRRYGLPMRAFEEFRDELIALITPHLNAGQRMSNSTSIDAGESMIAISGSLGDAAALGLQIPERLLDEALYWGIEMKAVRPHGRASFQWQVDRLRTLARG